MKILHIDSSIMQHDSITRELSAELVRQLVDAQDDATVIYRDVVKEPINHLTDTIAAGFRPVASVGEIDAQASREHAISDVLIEEFLGSDVVVIGAPMYNFSVSSQLKAWIDRLAQPGKTFRYTANGPEGLSQGRKIVIVSARGGLYHDTPLADMDYQERYLRAFFAFLGIYDVSFIRAEGMSKAQDIKQQGIAHALATIPDVVKTLSY